MVSGGGHILDSPLKAAYYFTGLPEPNKDLHAKQIAFMALHILRMVKHHKFPYVMEHGLMIRIGMHSGKYNMCAKCYSGVQSSCQILSSGSPVAGWVQVVQSRGSSDLIFIWCLV